MIITKVRSDGRKRKRKKCKPGFKLNSDGTACVPQSGSEKVSKKRAIKKALRTKKAKGASYKRKTVRKRLRAMRKRKGYGL